MRIALALLLAVSTAVLWGSLVQTQFNLAALVALGVDIPWAIRLRTTLADLAGFAPLYALIVLPALGIAFAVAAALARRLPRARPVLLGLSGLLGLMAAIRLVDALVPPPVMIAATRTAFGLGMLGLGGAAAGVLFWRLTRRG